MPNMRYFMVTQERQVRIAASTIVEAGLAASKLFAGEELDDVRATAARSPIIDRKLSVEEER